MIEQFSFAFVYGVLGVKPNDYNLKNEKPYEHEKFETISDFGVLSLASCARHDVYRGRKRGRDRGRNRGRDTPDSGHEGSTERRDART